MVGGFVRAGVVGFGGRFFGFGEIVCLFCRFIVGVFFGLFVVGHRLFVFGLFVEVRWIRQRILWPVQQATERVRELLAQTRESACGAGQSATEVAE